MSFRASIYPSQQSDSWFIAMISSTKAPKTKYQLAQAILKLRQPEITIHEVLDKPSAITAQKAIDTQPKHHAISVVIIKDRGQ